MPIVQVFTPGVGWTVDPLIPTSSGGTVQYANLAAFPATGVANLTYVAADTDTAYVWQGSGYVAIGGGALPVGGATGEALVKQSGADSDADWDPVALYNAPVTLSANTSLTHAAHANRTLIVDTAGLVLTINNDATGGWLSGDSIYIIPVSSGSATLVQGTGFLYTLSGTSAATGTAVGGVVAADRHTTDSWITTSPAITTAVIDKFSALKNRWGLMRPAGDNNAVWGVIGMAASPVAFDTSTLAIPTANDDVLGRMAPLQYTSAANAVNRGAGATSSQSFYLDFSSTGTEMFPIAVICALTDANPTDGCAAVGFLAGTVTTEPSSILQTLGFGFDVADANWQAMHNDGSGAATKHDLGASFVRAARTPIMFVIDRPSVAATYDLYAVNLTTGAVSAVFTVSSDVPASDRTAFHTTRWSMAAAFQAQIHIVGWQKGKKT